MVPLVLILSNMTPYLYFSVLLVATVGATTFRKNGYGNGKSYDESGESYSSGSSSSNHKSGYSVEGRNSPGKREYSGSYDGDDYIPPVGVQHNNDYSGLGEGYNDGDSGNNGGTGAISYSHVVSEHRPVHRHQPSRGLKAESTNIVENPVVLPIKDFTNRFQVPIPIVPAFDRPVLPLVPLAPVTRVIAPVKYPIHFFKPISYLAPAKNPILPKNDQPEYILTKVPLVYHATYSEGPQSSSGFNSPIPGVQHGAAAFNHGFHEFNHVPSTLNQGPSTFNNDYNNVHRNFNHFNPVVTTPGTPTFHFNHPPPPLVPTATPYHH